MSISNNAPALVVLAAGMGSRYGGLKQMDAFGPNGETILDYSIYDALQAGFDKVVFVIRESFEDAFREFFAGKFEDKVSVEYVFQDLEDVPGEFHFSEERTKPWGTAHAVWAARSAVDQPFVVINADDFYGRKAYEVSADFFRENSDANYGLVGYRLNNTMSKHGNVNRGVCSADADGYLTEVEETLSIGYDDEGQIVFPKGENEIGILSPDTLVSMNLWTFYPDYFKYCEREFSNFLQEQGQELKSEFFIPLLVENLIRSEEKKVKVLDCDEEWFGVTYQDDKPIVQSRLQELIDNEVYPQKLWE